MQSYFSLSPLKEMCLHWSNCEKDYIISHLTEGFFNGRKMIWDVILLEGVGSLARQPLHKIIYFAY